MKGYKIIVELLESFRKEIKNFQTTNKSGQKNLEQPFENLIDSILSNHKLYKEKKFQYLRNPNGSQRAPDFKIIIGTEKYEIECKSSKTKKAVWNCSLPNNETIYLFHSPKFSSLIIFNGNDILDSNDRDKLLSLHKKIQDLVNEESDNKKGSFYYYPRAMYCQNSNFEESDVGLFHKVVQRLSSINN